MNYYAPDHVRKNIVVLLNRRRVVKQAILVKQNSNAEIISVQI